MKVRYDCRALLVRSGIPRSTRAGWSDAMAGIQACVALTLIV